MKKHLLAFSIFCIMLVLAYTKAQAQLYIVSGSTTATYDVIVDGTNPVAITATSNGDLNVGVITTYLNQGKSVILLPYVWNRVVINTNISKTGGSDATLTIKTLASFEIAGNITSTSNKLGLILWADTDNSQADENGAWQDYIYISDNVTFNTNGGNLVLAGGLDNNSDGIPDGYAVSSNNSNNSGINIGPRAGTGTNISFISNGGNIIIKGKTFNQNSYPGITSQAGFRIDSGTGTIYMEGMSKTGNGIEFTWGQSPTIAITSSSTTEPAITLKGTTTKNNQGGFYAANNSGGNILIQSLASTGGGIYTEGVSVDNNGVAYRAGLVQILSQSGNITFKGKGGTGKHLYFSAGTSINIGNRYNSTTVNGVTPSVTNSSANVIFTGNELNLASVTNLSSTGNLTIEPYDASFPAAFTWSGSLSGSDFTGTNSINNLKLVSAANVTGLTIGKSTNSANVTISSAINVAGPMSIYGGVVDISANITSSADGNIFIQENAQTNTSFTNTGVTISKTAGTGTLTLKSIARVQHKGTITASGTGKLNVVFWSDYDASGNDGGCSIFGSINTNGGHFWAGGTGTNGGSYTWNGLTVGNGPSKGNTGYNNNALDLFGNITTTGGDVLLWAGIGVSSNIGIVLDAARSISAGAGNVTFIANGITGNGDLSLTTTGKIYFTPYNEAFNPNFTWAGTVSGSDITLNGTNSPFPRLKIISQTSVTGIELGRYNGHLSSETPVEQGNTANITVNSAINPSGPVSIYGGTLTLNENVSSSNGGNILFRANSLAFGSSKTVSSTGTLTVEPLTAGTTIGIGTGTGSLSIPSSYFTTNFGASFSGITIGSSTAGNITINGISAAPFRSPVTFNANGNLNLTGNIDLNGKTVYLGSNITLNEASGTFTGSTGTASTIRSLSNISSLNIGGLGATITTSANMGLTTVTRGLAVQTNGTNSGIKRYYDISPANNTGLNATLVFSYSDAELNGITENKLQMFKSEDGGTTWTPVQGTLNTTNNTYTVTGINNFSRWTLGSSDAPLPVELSSFTSSVNNRNVKLNWSTSSEQNNSGFFIERINNEELIINNWQNIGFIKGNGTTNEPKNYAFEDRGLTSGKYQYRLKQVDFNGNFEYHTLSGEVEIGVPSKFELGQNYPNPFNPSTKIDFSLPVDSKVSMIIFDVSGREVTRVINNEFTKAGYHTAQFNATGLSSGVYFYRIAAGNNVMSKKMLLIK